MVDKITFTEYSQLPGIINDRFHSLFVKDREDDRIMLTDFKEIMTQVFCGDIQTKMHLTFRMYDFDQDDVVTSEDIRLLMSFIPFKHVKKWSDNSSCSSHSLSGSSDEEQGLYSKQQGSNYMTPAMRRNTQKDIHNFLQKVLGQKQSLDFMQYQELNESCSSEMFFSLMSILHQNLPLAQFYFREKQQLKQESPNESYQQTESKTGKIKAIASPKFIQGLSPEIRKMTGSFCQKKSHFSSKTELSSSSSNLSPLSPQKLKDAKKQWRTKKMIQLDKLEKVSDFQIQEYPKFDVSVNLATPSP